MCDESSTDKRPEEERLQVDGIAMTPSEAEVIFEHYMEMAASIFELLPNEYEVPLGRFSDTAQEAVEAFFKVLQKEYATLEEQLENPEPDDQADI